jgi:hypothetical protein
MSSTASSAKRARGLEEINSDGDVDDGDDDGDDDDFVDVVGDEDIQLDKGALIEKIGVKSSKWQHFKVWSGNLSIANCSRSYCNRGRKNRSRAFTLGM